MPARCPEADGRGDHSSHTDFVSNGILVGSVLNVPHSNPHSEFTSWGWVYGWWPLDWMQVQCFYDLNVAV